MNEHNELLVLSQNILNISQKVHNFKMLPSENEGLKLNLIEDMELNKFK